MSREDEYTSRFLFEIILNLVNWSLGNENKTLDKVSVETWKDIYQLSKENQVCGLIYASVSKHKFDWNVPEDLLRIWGGRTKNLVLNEAKKSLGVRSFLSHVEKGKIKYLIFKGPVLAELYPHYLLRYSSDLDILMDKRDFPQMERVLLELGYSKNDEHSKNEVYVYVDKKSGLVLEIHFKLWEDYSGETIEILESLRLDAKETVLYKRFSGILMKTLGYTEHLEYQIFHIIKHFSIQTTSMRYMIDITLYIRRYNKEVDWKVFWENMEKLGYARFAYSFFQLCSEYLDMPSVNIEPRKIDVDEKEVPSMKKLILDDMAKGGKIYKQKMAQWQILGIMTPYLEGKLKSSEIGWKRKLQILFPSQEALPDKCSYARENKFLLPIAWGHKIIDFGVNYYRFHRKNNDWYSGYEKLKTAEYRLDLLQKLGLIEKKGR